MYLGICLYIEEVNSHAHLGLTLQNNMSWNTYVLEIYDKASKRLNMLKLFKFYLDRSNLRCLYTSLIRPLMEYADIVWDNYCTSGSSDLLESVQYNAAKIFRGAIKGTRARKLRKELAWVKLETRRKIHKLSFLYKCVNGITPSYFSDLVPLTVGERSNIRLRSANELSIFPCRTEMFKTSFSPSTTFLWNNLSLDIRQSDSLNVFKHRLNNLLHPLKYNRFLDFY